MADAKTEKQKVKEITDKLEEGLKELFESDFFNINSLRIDAKAFQHIFRTVMEIQCCFMAAQCVEFLEKAGFPRVMSAISMVKSAEAFTRTTSGLSDA